MSFPTQTVQYVTSPSSKLEAKEAAHKRFKYGSPQLRDVLRRQCRDRLRERRNNNFTAKRNLLNEERALIQTVVKDGISQFEQDVILQDLIYQELQEEIEEWLVQETSYLSSLSTDHQVICPLCQKLPLEQKFKLISCVGCNFKTIQYQDLSQLEAQINHAVSQHEVKCTKTLTFYSEPKFFNDPLSWIINCICEACDYLTTL